MTYYQLKKYLKKNGLTEGQADYVRGMVRTMVNQERDEEAHEWHESVMEIEHRISELEVSL